MRRIYQVLLPLLLLVFVVPRIGAQVAVANYPFSGNANDVSPYRNDASVHDATLTQDRFGRANQAYLFDGTQSYLLANNAPWLNTPTTSVSFWVRPDELPAQGEAYLLSFGGWQERWKISLPTHGKVVWTTNHTNGISDMDSGTPLTVGEWSNVVVVHDGTQDLIYINGELANSKAVVGNLNPTSRPFGMGYDPIDGANFFKGALDEILVYDFALTAANVGTIFAEQSTPPVVNNELVADYPFNGNLRDASPYANHARGTDVEFVPDRFGFGKRAVEFDGVSSEVDAPNSSQLNSPWTSVSFWVKPNSLPASGEAYLASFGGWQERWKISLPSHGKVVWTTNEAGGISDMDAGGGNELVVGEWTHVVAVHNTTQDVIYINGVQANAKDVGTPLNNTTKPLGLGYNPIDGGNYFDGVLDEFEVYNFPLTAQNVMDIYAEQSVAVIDPDPLVLNMPFCGDLKDVSQFRNDGESYNAEFTYDRFGYAQNAVYLDPAQEAYVEVANSVQYNTDYTTVSFWVNPDALPANGEAYLMSFGGWQERWKVSLPSHGKVVWTTNNSSGISDMDAGGGNELVPGTWTHVVTSHGPVNDKIYINGVLAATKAVGGTLNHTNHEVGVGWNPIDRGNYFDGDIDEVRIYNRDLTDQEVANLYTAQNAAPAFPGDIVANYPLNANGKDVSPYCNDGELYEVLANTDRFGRANHSLKFDGDSYVEADNSPQLNSPLATVSFWVDVNALPANGESYLLSFGGWQERWKISLPAHGKVVWTTNHTNGISDMDAGAGNELVPGVWTHLVFVHDGLKDYIYKDGVQVAVKDVVGLLNNTVHPLGMGWDPIDEGSYFDGSLDDVLIYDTALTAAEVAALYAAQAADPGETDITAPDAPSGLEGTVSFTNVELTWQASVDDESGIAGYNVYQNSSLIQTVEETNASITGLDPLTLYEFGVSAVDSAGNESGITFITLVTGPDETPDTIDPTAPTNLSVNPGANSVIFSWDASTDEGGLAGYVVSVDGNFVDSLDASTTSIFIGGLDPLTLYTFEVYAYDLAGNNSEISDITASTTAPIQTAEPGLVAHYKYDGNANDATPYLNHGAIGGNPTFETVTGRPNASGMCIVFDGDGDSVLAPNAVQLISDYATVSFWIRNDGQNLIDPEVYVIDFGHWSERWKISLPQHTKIVWTTNGNNVQFDHFIHDMDSGDGNELIRGFWWYVTMVHDGTDDIIYIDGAEVNRQPVATKLN
ncbi:MAG: LamG-like jellyroll fold domain-containing protein, partial [Saprospiraceae bacterium]